MNTTKRTSRKPRPEFFEPWTAQASKSYLPLNTNGVPLELKSEIEGNRESLEKSIPWIIWGSGMVPSGIAIKSNGHEIEMDDSGVIARIERNSLPNQNMPTQQQFAERICACVNACSDIPEPLNLRLQMEATSNELEKTKSLLKAAELKAAEALQAFSELLDEFHSSLNYELKE